MGLLSALLCNKNCDWSFIVGLIAYKVSIDS